MTREAFEFCHRQPPPLCLALVSLSCICEGCVLSAAASAVHPFVPLLPGEKATEQNNAPSCFCFCEGWPRFPVCCRSISLNRSLSATAKRDLLEQSSLLLRFTIAKTLSRMYIDFTVATFADLPLNDFSSYFKVKADCNHQRFLRELLRFPLISRSLVLIKLQPIFL